MGDLAVPATPAHVQDDVATTRVVVQPSLVVGAAHDPLEREADETADLVMRRLQAHVGSEPDDPPAIRRSTSGFDSGSVAGTRSSTDHAERADSSGVLFHTGPVADDLNQRLAARASICENNTHFASNERSARTRASRRLFAHETNHVVRLQRSALGAQRWHPSESRQVLRRTERPRQEEAEVGSQDAVPMDYARRRPGIARVDSIALHPRTAQNKGARLRRMSFDSETGEEPAPSAAPFQKTPGMAALWAKLDNPIVNTSSPKEFEQWVTEKRDAENVLRVAYERLQALESPNKNEALARSVVKRSLDVVKSSASDGNTKAPKGIDVLPRSEWWRLFIEGRHQGEDDPLSFDKHLSPGFYATMMQAYETHLSGRGSAVSEKLDFKEYDKMHEAVTSGVLTKQTVAEGRSRVEAVPHERTNADVYFPAAGPDTVIPALVLQELQQEGVAGPVGSTNPEDFDSLIGPAETHDDKTLPFAKTTPVVKANTKSEDVPDKVNKRLDAYYKERDAVSPEGDAKPAKLAAIARLVRALHVGHFYTDANGRLNTMLLLNRLLIDEGLSPVIMEDTSAFGGAKGVEALVEDIQAGLERFRQTVEKEIDQTE